MNLTNLQGQRIGNFQLPPFHTIIDDFRDSLVITFKLKQVNNINILIRR